MSKPTPPTPRRHDRAPTEAQRSERVRIDVPPDDALRRLMGARPAKKPSDKGERDD